MRSRKSIIQEPCGLSFTDLRAMNDDELMAHLSSGHDDALAVLFDRYHRLVRRIALKILRDVGEAEDLMQSVFMKIYETAAQFDAGRGTTKVWIIRFAYHRSINRRKHLIRRKFYATAELSEIPESKLGVLGREILPSEDARLLVKESLKTLNDAQRRVLKLAYLEGYSLQEIADATGESFGNVRHHYYRGLKKLRAFLIDREKIKTEHGREEIADAEA